MPLDAIRSQQSVLEYTGRPDFGCAITVCSLMSRIVIPLFWVLLSLSNIAQSQPSPMVVKHFDYSYSSTLQPYFVSVLELCLALTEVEYGDYKIIRNREILSAARAKLETEKGERLNVLFSSSWEGRLVNKESVIAHEFAALNDLLGLRNLIIRNAEAIPPQYLQTEADFKQLSAGQGFYWEDTRILRHAGIPVVEGQSFDALFPMLAQKRFDYLPLSMLEVKQVLKHKQLQHPNFRISPDIQIFYPMSLKLYVNAKEVALSERIALGLQKARGAPLEAVFQRHFPGLSVNQKPQTRLLMIDNPALSEAKNAEIKTRFLKRYGQHFNLLNDSLTDEQSLVH